MKVGLLVNLHLLWQLVGICRFSNCILASRLKEADGDSVKADWDLDWVVHHHDFQPLCRHLLPNKICAPALNLQAAYMSNTPYSAPRAFLYLDLFAQTSGSLFATTLCFFTQPNARVPQQSLWIVAAASIQMRVAQAQATLATFFVAYILVFSVIHILVS